MDVGTGSKWRLYKIMHIKFMAGSHFTHKNTPAPQLTSSAVCTYIQSRVGSVLHILRTVPCHCVCRSPESISILFAFYSHFILCCNNTISQRSNCEMHNAKIYFLLTNRASFVGNRWTRALACRLLGGVGLGHCCLSAWLCTEMGATGYEWPRIIA